ncbi:MAG TPA: glutamate--tRNA ligase [Stellaceae bacterium]|jgi:glutamyl-tRNA synthetase|nr:glutamate--tRNA ligase [Stellaceae bacterium]
MTKVRFAPSPTGRLHLGNARTALVNWLFARKSGGRFLLRLDDTDRERSREEFAAAIETDLRWLGLDWDEYERQSARLDRYATAAERLKSAGLLYPCFETAEELDLKRKLVQQRGQPWIYDRAALALDPAEIARRIAAGEAPHWRFKLEHRAVAWDDLVRGRTELHGGHLSDPVLIRADGMPLYTFTSVVDDVELGVSHVIRGEDHVTNTAFQIQIFEALGHEAPEFAHLSLITGKGGEALSKRMDSLSLALLRESGVEPMAVNSLLAKLGTSDAVEPRLDLAAVVAEFDLKKFGRAQPHLDPAELGALNAKLLHQTPFEAVAARLPKGATRAFWEAVRPNLERVADAAYWWRVCGGEIAPMLAPADAEFLVKAAELLPPEPFDATTWKSWTDRVAAATGRKGRALFHPVRLALTAREQGPELRALLPLIGRERALDRLQGKAA